MTRKWVPFSLNRTSKCRMYFTWHGGIQLSIGMVRISSSIHSFVYIWTENYNCYLERWTFQMELHCFSRWSTKWLISFRSVCNYQTYSSLNCIRLNLQIYHKNTWRVHEVLFLLSAKKLKVKKHRAFLNFSILGLLVIISTLI